MHDMVCGQGETIMLEQTVTQICTENLDSSLFKSNMVLVVGSNEELISFYEKVIPGTVGSSHGTVVTFTLNDETEKLEIDEVKLTLEDYDDKDGMNREEAETKYLEDVVEQLEKVRANLPDENFSKGYTIVFCADCWNMLERKMLLAKTSRKEEVRKDYGCHSSIIERLAKLCNAICKCKNAKLFIFRDEYNTAKYYKNTTAITDLESSCCERVFLSFGNTLNISVLSQELAEYMPGVKPLDVCYNLSGGKIGYIQRIAAVEEETAGPLEKYVLEFIPQHYIEAILFDKSDLSVSVIVDDASGVQKEALDLYTTPEKIISIIDESEDPYGELRGLVSDALDHKQLLEATSVKDPAKRQEKINHYKSPEILEYTDKITTAVSEALIKLLAPPLLGSKRMVMMEEVPEEAVQE